MIEHAIGLRKIVEKRVLQGKSYLEILRSIYGADPREVWEAFKILKEENVNKIGVKNEYPEFPEPHMAYSQWRITKEDSRKIIEKIKNKNYRRICFLGCPILGIEFSKVSHEKFLILDIDKAFLNLEKERFFEYNINAKIPPELKEKFDCVIVDPPWYDYEIKIFLKRASELARIGGTIYISIPKLLTRPMAIEERLELQRFLSNNNLIISEMQNIEYEVPPFEYMAYLDIPSFTGEVWRTGDLLKLKKADKFNSEIKIKENNKWLEFNFQGKRIFLKDKSDKNSNVKLRFIGDSLILNSVSQRNLLINEIDVWSSRNAVLHIDSGFEIVRYILDNFEKKDKEIIRDIIREYKVEEDNLKENLAKLREFINV